MRVQLVCLTTQRANRPLASRQGILEGSFSGLCGSPKAPAWLLLWGIEKKEFLLIMVTVTRRKYGPVIGGWQVLRRTGKSWSLDCEE